MEIINFLVSLASLLSLSLSQGRIQHFKLSDVIWEVMEIIWDIFLKDYHQLNLNKIKYPAGDACQHFTRFWEHFNTTSNEWKGALTWPVKTRILIKFVAVNMTTNQTPTYWSCKSWSDMINYSQFSMWVLTLIKSLVFVQSWAWAGLSIRWVQCDSSGDINPASLYCCAINRF